MVIRQSLLDRLAVELLERDSLHGHDVGDGVGVDEREPAADEVLLIEFGRDGEGKGGESPVVGWK